MEYVRSCYFLFLFLFSDVTEVFEDLQQDMRKFTMALLECGLWCTSLCPCQWHRQECEDTRKSLKVKKKPEENLPPREEALKKRYIRELAFKLTIVLEQSTACIPRQVAKSSRLRVGALLCEQFSSKAHHQVPMS